jgi:hypothetical protein
MKKFFLVNIILGFCLTVPAQTSKIKTCSVKGLKGGNYKLLSAAYTATEPKELLLDVSVKPKNFTKEYMAAVARRIRKTHCNERYVSVAIFDSKKAHIGWHYAWMISGGKIDRRRGTYLLDRNAGEEAIEFSSEPGKPPNEVRIVFAEPDKTKQE